MPDTKRAMVYVRHVLEDEYVQEQLRNAATGLRDAYERTRRERAQVTEDKRLYANLRQAATSIRNAATALQKKPEPEPKPRRLGKVAVLAVAVGGTAWLAIKMQKAASGSDSSATDMASSTASDAGAATMPPETGMPPETATTPEPITAPGAGGTFPA